MWSSTREVCQPGVTPCVCVCMDLQQHERVPGHRGGQGCITGWEERRREQKSRLWKEEVLGRNFSAAEAQLGRVPNVVAGTWGLELTRAGNLVMKCSSAPLTDPISFPATSSAMALPVITQPVCPGFGWGRVKSLLSSWYSAVFWI